MSNQLYMAYAEGQRARGLVRIVGAVGLSERERTVAQVRGSVSSRSSLIRESMRTEPSSRHLTLAWDLLSDLPEEDLIRVREAYIKKYHPAHKSEA